MLWWGNGGWEVETPQFWCMMGLFAKNLAIQVWKVRPRSELSIWIIEYANEWVDDVIASQFSINFVHRNDKNPIFQLWESKMCTLNKYRMFAVIYLICGHAFTSLSLKNEKFQNLNTKYRYMEKSEAMTSSTHSFAYSYQLFQEMFCWKLQNFKISYLPYFVSNLHQIFTVLFEFYFTLSNEFTSTWTEFLL